MEDKIYLCHIHRYDRKTNIVEGDNYTLFKSFDEGVKFINNTISKYCDIELTDSGTSYQFIKERYQGDAFIYTDGLNNKEFIAEYQCNEYPRDTYSIRLKEIKFEDIK